MEGKYVRFTKLLEMHLNSTIQKEFNGKPELTVELLRDVRDRLRTLIADVFTKSEKHTLTENAINWLANQYFSSIKIGNVDDKDIHVCDLIVINEYNLSDLPYHDIELLKDLYSTTVAPWAQAIREEHMQRQHHEKVSI